MWIIPKIRTKKSDNKHHSDATIHKPFTEKDVASSERFLPYYPLLRNPLIEQKLLIVAEPVFCLLNKIFL